MLYMHFNNLITVLLLLNILYTCTFYIPTFRFVDDLHEPKCLVVLMSIPDDGV